MKKKLFVALILSESSSNEASYAPLFEEDVVLIRAAALDEARERAREIAKERTHSFKNVDGQTIDWKLRRVVDVAAALSDDLDRDVVEIYSRHFRDIDAYEKFEPLLSGKSL